MMTRQPPRMICPECESKRVAAYEELVAKLRAIEDEHSGDGGGCDRIVTGDPWSNVLP